MDPRDHKGEEGMVEAAEDGMAGTHSWRHEGYLLASVNHDTRVLEAEWCDAALGSTWGFFVLRNSSSFCISFSQAVCCVQGDWPQPTWMATTAQVKLSSTGSSQDIASGAVEELLP